MMTFTILSRLLNNASLLSHVTWEEEGISSIQSTPRTGTSCPGSWQMGIGMLFEICWPVFHCFISTTLVGRAVSDRDLAG